MRNRRQEQLKTYSGFQIPKTVVTRYLKGDWSIDTLVKSIEKFNSDKVINNPNWKEKLREFETNYPGKTKQEVFDEILHESRAVDFFNNTDLSYGAALNEALSKVPDTDKEKKKLAALGKHVDFTEWVYNEENQQMEYFVNTPDGLFVYQVAFMDVFEGDYKNGALTVNYKKVGV